MEALNIGFALISIALGCFGWLAPKYTMVAVDLVDGGTTMGMSEVRASAGALFVGMGIGALILGGPIAYSMLGFCWLGAAGGRLTSLFVDGQNRKKWTYFAVEAVVGVLAIAVNTAAL